jgi:DegV family protein with EDD domain
LSGALSATYQSALIALKDVKDEYPDCNIYPVDSISASTGIWLLVDLIVKKRNEDLTAKEVVDWLEQKKHSCFGLFTVDDLMYLHRGGRLSKMQALAGSVLKVKPVLNLAPDGSLALNGKTRGRKASLELLTQQLKRSINTETKMDTVYIAHTDCQPDAESFAEMISNAVDVKKVEIMLMGPVIGAHVGPGALVVLFEADMTRNEYESEFYKK